MYRYSVPMELLRILGDLMIFSLTENKVVISIRRIFNVYSKIAIIINIMQCFPSPLDVITQWETSILVEL